jgi:hypothetical protein
MIATMGQAHLEWHRNAGVPVGLNCPFDVCDGGEWAEFDPEGYAAAVAQMEANQAAEAEWAESEEAQAVCEHGMSAWLCAGPGHYPMDDDY